MKSILQFTALLSSILLIASCGGGGGTVSNVVVTPQTPTNGAVGQAVKGIISGGTVTVVDNTGAAMALASSATTGADGTYSVTFTAAEIAAGIANKAPFEVIITGGSTVCDFDAPGTDNDCDIGDGTFVAFGESYNLPADFTLSGIIPAYPTESSEADVIVTINANPASTIAADLARAAAGSGAAVSAAQVDQAEEQVLALIQQITGVDMSDVDLNDISAFDASAPNATATAQEAALSAFGAALYGDIDATNTNVGAVITSLATDLAASAAAATVPGTVALTGDRLASIAANMTTVLADMADAGVATANTARATAERNQLAYEAQGPATVTIAPTGGTGNEALDQTRQFITDLSLIVGDFAELTGASGTLPNGTAPTEVFATALDIARDKGAFGATRAIQQLERSVEAAEAARATSLSAEGTTGTLAYGETGTVTLTDASSTYTDAERGIVTTITLTTGDRTEGNGAATFNASGVSMTFVEGEVTVQTFSNGTLAATWDTVVVGEATENEQPVPVSRYQLTSVTISGDTAAGAAGATFNTVLALTDMVGFYDDEGLECIECEQQAGGEETIEDAAFDLDITFQQTGSKTLSFGVNGTLQGENIGYAIGTNSGSILGLGSAALMGTMTVAGSRDTHAITDGTTTLTLVIENAVQSGNGQLVDGQGTLSVGGTNTGTVAEDGLVSLTDGTVQFLPAAIINGSSNDT